MPSAIIHNEESLPYGFAKGMKAACDAALRKRDPREAKAKQANSSAVRGQMGTLKRAPVSLLVQEVTRRLRAEGRRAYRREWMRNKRREIESGAGVL